MLEMLKSKSIIAFFILVIMVSFIIANDNKKTAEVATQNGQNEIVLYK